MIFGKRFFRFFTIHSENILMLRIKMNLTYDFEKLQIKLSDKFRTFSIMFPTEIGVPYQHVDNYRRRHSI